MKAVRPLTLAGFAAIAVLAGCANTHEDGMTTSSTAVTSPTASTTVTTPGSSTSTTGMGGSGAAGAGTGTGTGR